MKIISTLLLLILSTAFSLSAQQNQLSIGVNKPDSQLLYAARKIDEAAVGKQMQVTLRVSTVVPTNEEMAVQFIADSTLATATAIKHTLKQPVSLGWQCYSIRVQTNGKQKITYVLAGDPTGCMYGGLDIAEAIRTGTPDQLTDSDNKPYLERRGIKFNIPLDLRTPSYTDPSDAAQQNIPTCGSPLSGPPILMKWPCTDTMCSAYGACTLFHPW